MAIEKFELCFKNERLIIERVALPGQVIFRIVFPGQVPELVILRATGIDGARFWTSMPEGKQAMAQEIGPLIEQYYRSQIK